MKSSALERLHTAIVRIVGTCIIVLLCLGLLPLRTWIERAAGLPRGDARLWGAVVWDDATQIPLALREGANINATNSSGMTPLMMAASGGSPPLVRALLDHDADPNKPCAGRGFTPLLGAITFGQPDSVRMLIDTGACVNPRSPADVAPIIVAALRGNPEIVKLLIDAGADASAVSSDGDTAMVVSLRHGHTKIAAFLQLKAEQRHPSRSAEPPQQSHRPPIQQGGG
jgi:ankyrin repeat protein